MSEAKGSLLPNFDAQEYMRKQFVLSDGKGQELL